MNNEIKIIVFMLWLNTWLKENESIEDLSNDELLSLKEKWEKYWEDSLNQEHDGDCTNKCYACTRCAMESLIKEATRIHTFFDNIKLNEPKFLDHDCEEILYNNLENLYES